MFQPNRGHKNRKVGWIGLISHSLLRLNFTAHTHTHNHREEVGRKRGRGRADRKELFQVTRKYKSLEVNLPKGNLSI